MLATKEPSGQPPPYPAATGQRGAVGRKEGRWRGGVPQASGALCAPAAKTCMESRGPPTSGQGTGAGQHDPLQPPNN